MMNKKNSLEARVIQSVQVIRDNIKFMDLSEATKLLKILHNRNFKEIINFANNLINIKKILK